MGCIGIRRREIQRGERTKTPVEFDIGNLAAIRIGHCPKEFRVVDVDSSNQIRRSGSGQMLGLRRGERRPEASLLEPSEMFQMQNGNEPRDSGLRSVGESHDASCSSRDR